MPGNVASLGFEATSTREFGDHVRFTPGSKRRVREVTVVLSSWGCETGAWNTGDCRTSKRAKFRHPITLNLYGVSGGGLGPLLATTTEKFKIPYRPSASSKCGDGRWYSRKEKTCFNGFALEVSFKLREGVTLPDEVIWGVAYSTTHHGYAPVGQGAACFTEPGGCGYDSLNVGSESLALVGTDVDPDGAYLNTTHAPFYCDGGAGGVGTFRNDTGPPVCWTGFRPMAKFEARGRGGDDD